MKEEIAEDEEEGLIHQRCVGQSLTVRVLLLFGGNQKALFEGAHVKDFDDGHAGDAKEVGGVGGEQAGLNQADNLEDEGGGGAGDPHVEAGIEEVVLIFQKAEFELSVAGAVFDLAHSADANSVHGDLQTKKNGQGDEVGRVHSVSFRRLIFSGEGGFGQTQSIAGEGAGMKPGRFEGGSEKEREKSGLQEAWGEPPRTGALGERVRQPTPEGENEKPGADQKKEGAKKK